MNGIHLEAYVLSKQLREKRAPVALHCERGCPFQNCFMRRFTQLATPTITSWPGYRILGPNGSSVCEKHVPFGENSADTVENIAEELKRLQL
eukprot:UN06896